MIVSPQGWDGDPFVAGAISALESFRHELISERGHIENEAEPVFDVILDLLDRVITVLVPEATEAKS